MQKQSRCMLSLIVVLGVVLTNCGDSSGPSSVTCGEGKGHEVQFCRQVDHYAAGFGVPGQDVITVDCLIGPAEAMVSNQTDGTYHCSGRYKLSTFSSATISLNWGGTTSYSEVKDYKILAPGEGSFSITVTKISGGAGNMFLSMASGSKWMFDTILVSTNCSGNQGISQNQMSNGSSIRENEFTIEKSIPRSYGK